MFNAGFLDERLFHAIRRVVCLLSDVCRQHRKLEKCKCWTNITQTAEPFFKLQTGAKSSPIRHLRLGDRLTKRQGGKNNVWVRQSFLPKILGNPSPPYPWIGKRRRFEGIRLCVNVWVFWFCVVVLKSTKNKTTCSTKLTLREEIKSNFFSRNSQLCHASKNYVDWVVLWQERDATTSVSILFLISIMSNCSFRLPSGCVDQQVIKHMYNKCFWYISI